jgi:hypothetical protein
VFANLNRLVECIVLHLRKIFDSKKYADSGTAAVVKKNVSRAGVLQLLCKQVLAYINSI